MILDIQTTDGQSFDLPPNKGIRFEMVSPLFGSGFVQSGKSFPFSLRNTPNNDKLLGYNRIAENIDPFEVRIPVVILIRKKPWFKGSLTVKSYKGNHQAHITTAEHGNVHSYNLSR